MGVTGDFAGLDKLAQALRRLSNVGEDIAPKAADKWSERTKGYFATQTSPYGRRWPSALQGLPLFTALKKRRKSYSQRMREEAEQRLRRTGKAHTTHAPHALLVATGAMRNGVAFIPVGDYVRFDTAGLYYAKYQISARGRRYAPKPGRRPAEWEQDIRELRDEAITKRLG